MNLKNLLSRLTINRLSKFNSRRISSPSWNYREICSCRWISPPPYLADSRLSVCYIKNPKIPNVHSVFHRFIHLSQETVPNGAKSVETVSVDSVNDDDDDAVMNEFLSRFVWIMRWKLTEVYTDADKNEINAMLRIIVGKVVSEMGEGRLEHFMDSAEALLSEAFSEDLWETVREVSSMVLEDMKKAKKKEKMKNFLQSEEVKEMTRFAGEIGIRGDMLRELRFKWAREKLEDSEFYESLEHMRKDVMEPEVESQNHGPSGNKTEGKDDNDDQEVSLPKRSGKINYTIYGLDLSKPKWVEVAEQIHETGGSIWPQEPKPISGKCKIVTEKIVSLRGADDPLPLIAEWIELLQPSRVDWLALLDRLNEKNEQMYFKVSELLLDEESFETNLRDYSQLVDSYAKHDRLDDAERIIIKMNVKGITPDFLTKSTMVHMYSKAGNLNLAKQAFESLRTQGFQPDLKVYNSIIMAHVNAGDPESAELLMKDMKSKNFKPSKDMYLALIQSFARKGVSMGASRIAERMQLEGHQPGVESNTYLVEAYTRKGNLDQAKEQFDEILNLGFKPDDTCTAQMIEGYARKNYLDKAVHLLLQLEKDGIEIGLATYAVLINWFGRLQLVDEAEDLLEKFSEKGVSPSVDVRVSVCEMYARARDQKKALQALGVLEANKDKLGRDEFERVIKALLESGFREEGSRMHDLMVARGFTASDAVLVPLQASKTFFRSRPPGRSSI